MRHLLLADIERRSQHADDLAVGVHQRRLRRQEVTFAPLGRLDRFLVGRVRQATGQDAALHLAKPRNVRPRQQRFRGKADAGGRVAARIDGKHRIHEDASAIAIGGADERRHRIDDLRQLLAAVAHGDLAEILAVQQTALKRLCLQLDALLLAAELQEVARPADELFVVDGRLQEVRRARLERHEPKTEILVGRQHDDGNVGGVGHVAQATGQLGAVHARHLVVRDDEVRLAFFEPVEHPERACEGFDVDVLSRELRQARVYPLVAALIINNDYQ